MPPFVIGQSRSKKVFEGKILPSRSVIICHPTLYNWKRNAKQYAERHKDILKKLKDRPLLLLKQINEDHFQVDEILG